MTVIIKKKQDSSLCNVKVANLMAQDHHIEFTFSKFESLEFSAVQFQHQT